MNISGILVQTKAETLDQLIEDIKVSKVCEYHHHDDKGRIIVTIEGDGIEEEISKLKKLKAFKNVIAADMIYAYSEDELDKLKSKLENSDNNLPEWLNKDDVKAGEIRYNGDLRKK